MSNLAATGSPPAFPLPRLVVLPSVDGGRFFLYALPPVGQSADAIQETVTAVVRAANSEDAGNDRGGCDDGLCVEESVQRRLTALGFQFLRQGHELVHTVDWDRVPPRPAHGVLVK